MSAVRRGLVRWAPWPGPGGPFQVRALSSPGRRGFVAVRWVSGPLKGREATLEARTLRSCARDIGNSDAS